ncbi:MAG: right-handed parallel beta-helix repeat-containing protein [Candidatus Thermoplasmatota archaeon]|nr:right-handed parallel beta-helix repeat-containing protein [Candidatus Thermoplasmatota archaeon]
MKKKFAFAVVFLLFLTFTEITSTSNVQGKTIYVGGAGQGNYTSIQDAVNNASDGDEIYIFPGFYHEHVVINKSVSLIGKSENSTVVDADFTGNAIEILSSSVKISNLTVRNGGGEKENALIKVSSDGNEIKNCTLHTCRNGILLKGNGNCISGCTIHENGNGVEIQSDENDVGNCILYKNGMGIEFYNAYKNVISKCIFHTNGIGVYMENSSGNVINGCDIYKNSGNEGGIFFINSDANIITNSSVNHNVWSVRLVNCNENEISKCEISESRFGIKIEQCRGNEIYGCNITRNRYGIYIEKCSMDKINFNNIADNHMYGLYAKFGIENAKHNWWGSASGPGLLGDRISPVFSKVSYMPWLLQPIPFEKKFVGNGEMLSQCNCHCISDAREGTNGSTRMGDWDPLVDLKLKVNILRVRNIDLENKSVFSVVGIDGRENASDVMKGMDISPGWKAMQDVPDDKENIPVVIYLFEKRLFKKEIIKVGLVYNMERGEWYGDDYVGDEDGCGHITENGYEVWFDISFNDYDGDGLTYWEETNVYHTDPEINDTGSDSDNDGLPMEWEDKWGYNPFVAENHSVMDPDDDGLTNFQEWQLSQWLSDPFRQDIFIEVDYMAGKNGRKPYILPEKSKQMLYSSFTKHNIVMHVDDGCMGGGEEIPYKEKITYKESEEIYWKYFLHGNMLNPRKGIFHYAILCSYGATTRGGYSFQGLDNLDTFVLAVQYIRDWRLKESERMLSTASLFMHELGHNLGLFEYTFSGIDNESCNTPWHVGWYVYEDYKSCLNYRYSFSLVDYSDGSHKKNDYDDWSNIDLTFFKNSRYYI